MKLPSSPRPSRREFLGLLGRGAAVGTLAGLTPRLLAATARKIRGDDAPRALVLVQLEGGNDWRNTLVPHGDDTYYRARPTLALRNDELVFIADGLALHHAAGALAPLYKDGRMAVIEDVGCAAQSPSHYRATEVWHTASGADEVSLSGWAGRALEQIKAQGRAVTTSYSGSTMPRVLWTGSGECFGDALPSMSVTNRLAGLAEAVGAGTATEVHFVSAPGFDTHYDQRAVHAARLGEVAGALAQFQKRIEQRGVGGRVLTVVFSEFGRTAAENEQGGTDHGGPGAVLALGTSVVGGRHREGGELIDFRRVVRSTATNWLGVPSGAVFARDLGTVEFIRS